jgi:transcription elongation factor GreA
MELREMLSQFLSFVLNIAPLKRAFFIRSMGRRAGELTMEKTTSFLTAEGYKKLQAELKHLKTVRRREVAEKIRSAKEDGDISENAGYEQAKEEQAFVEGRIMTLEHILSTASIIQENGPADRVVLGSHVTVVEIDGDRRSAPETYRLVGSTEADPSSGRVSHASPLGQALMGKEVGDSVVVSAPGGEICFKVVGID